MDIKNTAMFQFFPFFFRNLQIQKDLFAAIVRIRFLYNTLSFILIILLTT